MDSGRWDWGGWEEALVLTRSVWPTDKMREREREEIATTTRILLLSSHAVSGLREMTKRFNGG